MTEETLEQKIQQETGVIPWEELQRFYAQGRILCLNINENFEAVALAFAKDEKSVIEPLVTQGLLQAPDDQQALAWIEGKASLRALVLAPWILVQPLH